MKILLLSVLSFSLLCSLMFTVQNYKASLNARATEPIFVPVTKTPQKNAGNVQLHELEFITATPIPDQPPVASSSAKGNLLEAAKALKGAYAACLGGTTGPGQEACLRNNLKQAGFPQRNIDATIARRSIQRTGCTQCLAFLGMILSLYSADTTTVPYPSAKDMLSVTSFSAGNHTWVKLPPGTRPQPGDIGVTAMGGGGFGHDFVVNQVVGANKVTAVESNWVRCKATDNVPHLTAGWTFYREK